MKQLSWVDLSYLVNEFKVLENQRIDSFYYENKAFYLKVYVKGKGHFFLTNKVSESIYLGTIKPESVHPNSFIQYLRKYLKNGFVRKIEQIPNERILKIEIETKQGEELLSYFLYLEIFANGNIILCDSNNTIKNSLIKKTFKDRTIRVHNTYELPPAKELTLSSINEKQLKEVTEEFELVKFLALKFGLGGKYAEEVCARLKLDKNILMSKLNSKQIKQLFQELKDLLHHKIEPQFEVKDEKNINFYPFKFESLKDKEIREEKSFNDCVRVYFEQFLEEKDRRGEEFTKELKKLENRLKKQQTQLEQVKLDYEKYNSYGNIIYENYSEIEELLTSINKASKEKGWENVEETIKSNKKLKKKIKKLDYKNNSITLNF